MRSDRYTGYSGQYQPVVSQPSTTSTTSASRAVRRAVSSPRVTHRMRAPRTAAHLLAAVQGARIGWVTLGDDTAPRTAREALVVDVVDGWLTTG